VGGITDKSKAHDLLLRVMVLMYHAVMDLMYLTCIKRWIRPYTHGINMPVADGIETARMIMDYETSPAPHVPIIALTPRCLKRHGHNE
jgi:DNA-binding LytR/AlgR family response regulator